MTTDDIQFDEEVMKFFPNFFEYVHLCSSLVKVVGCL